MTKPTGRAGWPHRALTRLWLLAGSLSILSLLLLGRCGIQDGSSPTGTPGQSCGPLLEQREEEARMEVARLSAEIRALKLRLLHLTSEQGSFVAR